MKIGSSLLFLLIFSSFIITIQSFELLHASKTFSSNTSPFQSRNVVFTLTENIILVSPVNNSVLPSGTIIRFNISDFNLVELHYHWDNEPNNTWLPPYETMLPMGDGLHILQAYALDTLDSWEYQEYHFITDDTSPIILLTSAVNNSDQAPESVINLDIVDTHLDRVLYSWNKGNNLTLNIPYRITLPREEGTHELTVYASDIVGHWVKERFLFTTRPDLSPDSDNDGLSDYIEILLGTNPSLSTNRINDAPIDITDLVNDAPNSLQTALINRTHIPATTWVIGTVDEMVLEDQSDFFIFTTQYRTKGTIFLQTNLPTVKLTIFDLEDRVNLSHQVQNTDLSISQTIRFRLSTISDYAPNALPYIVEIPIPLAIELLVVQIDGGMAGKTLYSIWMVEDPANPYLPVVILLLNLLLFLGLPFFFFMILRWENRRVIKKQEKIKPEESPFLPLKTEEVIIKVRFYEWIFSSLILLVMVLLFSELSREKFLNEVTVLTAKSFVDLGYRIFFLAITLLLVGIIVSIGKWGLKKIHSQPTHLQKCSWTKSMINLLAKASIILVLYFIFWTVFLQFIVFLRPQISSLATLADLQELFTAFFTKDLLNPPSSDQIQLLTNLGILELIFIFFAIPLALYMFFLNFSGGTSIRTIFQPMEKKKSRWNYKTIILGLSLIVELYRIFSNLINYLISILFTENSTFFFIQISEIPWWHQVVTWISQETLISTPFLYGLYFELLGIFFAWVIYTSLPPFISRLMAGEDYSKSLIRIGIFLLGMFVIFLRTMHLLLLIPIGVPSFPFSIILSDPFSILLIIAMISEILEIVGFSLGLLVVLYIWKFRKIKEPPSIVVKPSPSIVLPEDTIELEEINYTFEEE